MLFGSMFMELLALLGSVILFGVIIVTVAFVTFVVACILRAMIDGFKKSGGKNNVSKHD